MTTKIYKVLSNLKHDDMILEKGSYFEAEAIDAFENLVKDGVLKHIEADTLEEAQKLDAEFMAKQAAAQANVAKPENTVRAVRCKEEAPAEATDETKTDATADADKTTETQCERQTYSGSRHWRPATCSCRRKDCRRGGRTLKHTYGRPKPHTARGSHDAGKTYPRYR